MKFHKKEKKRKKDVIRWCADYNQSVICYEVNVSQPNIC